MRYMMQMWTATDATDGSQSDFDAWATFETSAREAGIYLGSGAFEAPAKAKLIETEVSGYSLADSVHGTTYSDTKEQVAAYYLLQCPDLDAALEWAHKLPTYGCVEVRQLLETEF